MTMSGFNHSIKVNRLYKIAAKIIKEVNEDRKGVKGLLFQQTHVNIKALNALVFETLKYAPLLDLLLRKTNLLINEPRLDPWLARVLMTELLWGRTGVLTSEAKPIKTVLAYHDKFTEILKDAPELPSKVATYHPRYVRVNTLLLSVQDAVHGFRNEGWTLVRSRYGCTYEEHLRAVRDMKPNTFMIDYHIPELLVFPPNTDLHDFGSYINGHIILQDKASCMASHVLAPTPGSHVLDMCAAPGMKTTHLVALIGDDQVGGKIYAVERDARRYSVLKEMIEKIGAKSVVTINEDVLRITDKQCPDVEYVLVDPSCSGSGMLDRIDVTPDVDEKRLQSLAGFQILVLRHALTAYPKAKRVLYSTCSIMPQENEQVVKEVLETTKQFELVSIKEKFGKDWLNYGSEDDYPGIGEKCLRAKSLVDYTNGFFMALFERVAPHDEKDLYVRDEIKPRFKKNFMGKKNIVNGNSKKNYGNGNNKRNYEKTFEKESSEIENVDEKPKRKRVGGGKIDGNVTMKGNIVKDDVVVKKKSNLEKDSSESKMKNDFEKNSVRKRKNVEVVMTNDDEVVIKKNKKKLKKLTEQVEIDTVDLNDAKATKKCKKSKKSKSS